MDENIWPLVENILFDPLMGKFIFLAIIFIVIGSTAKILQRTLGNRIHDNSMRYRLRKFIDFLFFVVLAIATTVVFSDRLGNLTVAFGVAGAGIAFALQEIIASIAGWVAISLNNFFRPGDRVLLGGICGDVIDVGVLRTTLMECGGWVDGDLYNGRIVRVANSSIFKEPVYNYNTDFPFVWDEITLPIRYGSDLKRTRRIMENAAEGIVGQYSKEAERAWKKVVKKYMIDDARVYPMVTIAADENWVTYTTRYVTDYRLRRATKNALFSNILDQIEQSEGTVKIASAAMDITTFPPVEARILEFSKDNTPQNQEEKPPSVRQH